MKDLRNRFDRVVSYAGWTIPSYIVFSFAVLVFEFTHLQWTHLVFTSLAVGFAIPLKRRAFAEVFLIAFTIWIVLAFIQDVQTGFRLSTRISQVFGASFAPTAYIATGMVSGFICGSAAACSQRVRQWLVCTSAMRIKR